MSFRGGRGRGRGSFAFNATPQPFKLFPEDVQLPDAKKVPMDTDYFKWNNNLKEFYLKSVFLLEESGTSDCQKHDIERYSDSLKLGNKMKRDSLSDVLILKPGYFPLELIEGVKTSSSRKKVNWDPAAADKRFFELLEKKEKEKGEKETDSEEEIVSEEDQEFSDDGDYGQNQDFDDDEDDYNDKDDGDDDEAFY